MKTVLCTKDLQISAGRKILLQGMNVSVKAGEFIGIIGVNGVGKSTFIRSLCGQHHEMTGGIWLRDRKLTDYSEKELARQVAYMQQDVQLGFGFSVEEIVLSGRYPHLSWWQNEGKEDRDIVYKYMEFVGVDKLAKMPVNQLSGGERQRVLLAKVLAQETELIYLDEPTSNLDLRYQEEIFRYCRSLCDAGKTILCIVHDIRLAAKFCSRLLLLASGRILADGRPEKVIAPATLHEGFGLNAAVYNDVISGDLGIYTFGAADNATTSGKSVYIEGAGSEGAAVMRHFYELGFTISVTMPPVDSQMHYAARAFRAKCCHTAAEIAAGRLAADLVVDTAEVYREINKM